MTPRDAPRVAFRGEEHLLLSRLQDLARGADRTILGVCGPPGAGKSTLAGWLAAAVSVESRVVAMDGFHLSNATLEALHLHDRKGAIETFDADGYAALLARLRRADEPVVHAPSFHRDIEEPIAASTSVEQQVPLVITEGNYLLADGPAWQRARSLIDEVWFVDVDPQLRRERLVARHVHYGKTREQALAWVASVDERNAELIAATRSRADVLVELVDDVSPDEGEPSW